MSNKKFTEVDFHELRTLLDSLMPKEITFYSCTSEAFTVTLQENEESDKLATDNEVEEDIFFLLRAQIKKWLWGDCTGHWDDDLSDRDNRKEEKPWKEGWLL